ncbi:MAG TPA: diacylglycerol kinase family protein [Opitutaceae bacterium]|jgi:YegS/Rv2252/BmrU family lipid kinase|nr:diacylglycerol kinase family protein [Opitutaceae bacterium]
MRTLLIYNPTSGRAARTARLLPLLRAYAAGSSGAAAVAITEGPGHATVLARDAVAAGAERVVAVGGDGTLNETAQSLVGTPAALGLVPCGSGNGLARHLRLPAAPEKCLRLIAHGHPRVASIDTGIADGRPFFNAMGFGLDAEVSRRFNRLRRRGLPAYARTVWDAFRTQRPERCTISNGTRRATLDLLLLAVANSDQYGNNAYIAPRASVADGELDLVSVPPVPWMQVPLLIARLFSGSIDRTGGVEHWRGSHFRIERPAPGLIHTDGETHAAAATFEVSVLPSSLRVLLPPPAP